jgi:site-specific recombinase XerD
MMGAKPKSGPSLARHVESFFRSSLAEQRRVSPATIASYRDGLKLFLIFAAKRAAKDISSLAATDLDADTVLAFLQHIEGDRHNSIRTRNVRRTTLRAFFRHLALADPTTVGIAERMLMIPAKRSVRPALEYLREPEQEALLATPDRSRARGRRDFALLLFLVRTGARESETISVDTSHVRMTKPRQVLLFGKGSKERLVPLCDHTVAAIEAMLADRRDREPASPLFRNHRGERLTRYGVIHIVSHAVAQTVKDQPSLAGRSISPHVFRHTCAMNLLRSGVDLTTIQAWLGHVNLDTTHRYMEADVEMKRRALERCPITTDTARRYSAKDPILELLESL